MSTIEISTKKALLSACLFLTSLSVLADGIQESLNLDYFRTPEAAAFKKYGEEAVNEYTGTADISVPLYTVKCKDVEIPITLRYDASGIKVEQEASWVGLGWNLMVGGCINYVCAGGHDMFNAPNIPNNIWTEYLTSAFTPWITGTGKAIDVGATDWNDIEVRRNRTMYYTCNPNETFNWMNKLPYESQRFVQSYVDMFSDTWGMRGYIDWGYGERDFYSVNVMGKSFMFFIDPFTLNVYNIGKAGEDFKVEITDPELETRGICRPATEDIKKWKITDSSGYVYYFEIGDKFMSDARSGISYNSCWYLTKIQSPTTGAQAEFEYESLTKTGRTIWTESYKLPFFEDTHAWCCSTICRQIKGDVSYRQNENQGMNITAHYLRKIKTENQTVNFYTSESNECSGKKLDRIEVKSYDGINRKTIKLTYGSFIPSAVGGNYAPQDTNGTSRKRLKLVNVKEIASSETLTTSFSYNSKQLPSKRSCAQDYWGYYNGKENYVNVVGRNSLLPRPKKFMSFNHSEKLDNIFEGADRNSDGEFMQAAMLNKVVYPTGGYTTYEYEPNSFVVYDYRESLEYEEYLKRPCDIDIYKFFSYTPDTPVPVSNTPYNFTLEDELPFTLYVKCNGDAIDGQSITVVIAPAGGSITPKVVPLTYMSSEDYRIVLQDTLPPGSYQLIIGAPSSGQKSYGIGCRLRGNYASNSFSSLYPQNKFTRAAGGLRIKKICNYDHDSEIIDYTTYDYHDGALLNKIETIDYAQMFNLVPKHYNGMIANDSHIVDLYTITPGHPRMPTFFACCSPGIVGYSYVTKNKYNANGELQKSVVTAYRNNEPRSMWKLDYYEAFDNGLINWQEVRDASGATVERTANSYDTYRVDHYATNIVAKNKTLGIPDNSAPHLPMKEFVYIVTPNGITSRTDYNNNNYDPTAVFVVLRYPYILSRADLTKTTTTEHCPDGSTIVRTKEYGYNTTNHQVSQIDESTSHLNQKRRTRITYSADGTDNVSKAMKNAHRLNEVVETKTLLVEDGQEHCISTQHTNYTNRYSNGTSHYLPGSFSKSIGDNAPETRTIYSYDDSLNVRSITVDGMEAVYIWSYKGQYPIAKIEGLTYAEVKNAIGSPTISTLLRKAKPSAADLNSIRTAIKHAGGHITTYTYKPLVGIASETQPNDYTVYYEYDSFGRLVKVKDQNGSVISTNSYNYKK